ncbi:MAG: type II toxin-antitoxin system Phd/YefM family antitoxin [Desulfobulbaceae bacterium]|nr:type II toxin-antitoxin system Phd/YefM family antitoxin [Desulfobulbaceae bacterium]
MQIKFSEDIVPVSVLKVNPGKIVKQVQEVHRPVVLTSRGRGVAVVQSLQDYEANMEQQSFMKAVVKGLVDLEEGRELSLAEVRKHLKI